VEKLCLVAGLLTGSLVHGTIAGLVVACAAVAEVVASGGAWCWAWGRTRLPTSLLTGGLVHSAGAWFAVALALRLVAEVISGGRSR